MPYFFSEYITNEKNAGNKARKDVETIFTSRGYKKIDYIRSTSKIFLKRKMENYFLLRKSLQKIPNDELLFIQYPFMSGGNTLLPYICKERKVGIVIHDLDSLRMTKDARLRQKQIKTLKKCKYIIAQNSEMKDFMVKNGCSEDKIFNLEVFDYLTSNIVKRSHFNDKNAICFSGNLKKSGFIYSIKAPLSKIGFSLYGNGLNMDKIDSTIEYEGAFDPEEVHKKLEGKFGLVWDGPSIDKCSGLLGEYLQYNDPHKLSMYVVAGLPIIIWDKAAEAGLVKQLKIGLTVASLAELPDVLSKVDEKKYEELRQNVVRLAQKMSTGYFLNHQLDMIENRE